MHLDAFFELGGRRLGPEEERRLAAALSKESSDTEPDADVVWMRDTKTLPPAGNKVYPAVIVQEDLVEMPYVHGGDGNPNPRLFQLGLLSGLQGQYVGVKFDALIMKGTGYAHAVVGVVRP